MGGRGERERFKNCSGPMKWSKMLLLTSVVAVEIYRCTDILMHQHHVLFPGGRETGPITA